MAAPSPEDQVRFLTNIQRLLTEGAFTATYKYALLLALADLAVEHGDDSGDPMAVPTRLIAERFIALYWQHAAPYVPQGGGSGVILQQNTDRQAAIIRLVADARAQYGALIQEVRRKAAWKKLVRDVETVVCVMPLWKLQRLGNDVHDFLYEQAGTGRTIDTPARRGVLLAPLSRPGYGAGARRVVAVHPQD